MSRYNKTEIEQLKAIGKQVKLAMPGEFNEYSDFAVGEVSVKKGLWPLKSPKNKPVLFVGTRTNLIKKQTEYAVTKATQDLLIEKANREAEAEAAMSPRRIAQKIFEEEQQFEVRARQNNLQKQLIDAAAEKSVDVPTHNLIRLEEEKARIEIEKKQQEVAIALHQARELKLLDVEAEAKKHELDIKALEQAKRVEQNTSRRCGGGRARS